MTASTGFNIVITAKDSASPVIGKTRAELESISRQLQVMRNAWLALQGVTGLSGGVAALAGLADQVQQVNARLRLAVDGARQFAEAQRFAYRVAAQTGAGYEAIATLYGRLAQAADGYGLSQEQIARTTEATALALKVSGASAAEAASVVRQFSQALGSGVLRGDEFNSIMENGGRLAKALADGLGLPVGRLRELSEQGLLTTDVITRALESQRKTLQREAQAMPRTIGQALSQVRDEFGRTVDRLNQAGSVTSRVADAFTALARNMDAVFGAALTAAVGALSIALARAGQAAFGAVAGLVAKLQADRQAAVTAQILAQHEVAKAQAMLAAAQAAVAQAAGMARLSIVQNQLIPAQQRLAAAQAALNTAMSAGGVAARALSTALGFIGGPLGAILTLLTMGATAWAIWGDKAQSAADKARAGAERAADVLERLRKRQRFGEGDAATLREEIERLEKLQSVREETLRRGGSPGARKLFEEDKKRLEEYRKALIDLRAIEQPYDGSSELGKELLGKRFDNYLDQYRKKLDPLGSALKELRKEAEKAGIALDSPKFKEAEALLRKAFANEGKQGVDQSAARLALLKSEAEAEFALIKDSLERQKRELDAALEDRLVSIRDYYAKKTAIEQQEIDAERARREQELAAVRAIAANKKASEADRLRALGEVKKLEAEIEILNRRRADVAADNARRQAAAERELANELARVRERLAEIKGGAGGEVTRARLERELQPLIDKLKAAGDEAGAADVRRLIDVESDLAELGRLEREYQLVMERMAIRERELQVQKDAGMLTEMQMRREVLNLHQQTAAEVEGLIPRMQELAEKTGSEEAINRVARLKVEVAGLKTEADDVATRINGDVQNAFVTMFEAIGSGAKRASDAFRDFARSVIASIQRIAAQKFAEQIFGSFGKGGGIGGFFSSIFKFAAGGPVPGSGDRDTVPALLTPGEFVIRRDAVRRVGLDLLHAINGGGWVPRVSIGRLAFASGGVVPAVGGTVNNVSVVVNTEAGGRVQGDSAAAADLGRRIEAAVRGVLVAEKRPGGLLAGA